MNKSIHAAFNKPTLLFIAAIIILWLNFSSHALSTLSVDKFIDGEFPSERYVFSRLIHNLEHGPDTDGGLMIAYDHVDMLHNVIDRDVYTQFKQQLVEGQGSYTIYHSHAGLQDNIVFPIWQGLDWLKGKILEKARPGSRWHKRLQTLDYYYYKMVSQSIVALVNACALSLFLLWVARQFSTPHAWITLGLMLITLPVLTFYGRSMWWMMWSWFLPMLITLWGLYRNKGGPPGIGLSTMLGLLAGAAICTKIMMGYEFISTIMVATMIPIIFYALLNQWSLKDWLKTSAIIGALCVGGALAGIALHIKTLYAISETPIDLMLSTFDARAYGGGDPNRFGGEITKSVVSSPFALILDYLISPKELAIPQILFLAPFLLWLRKQRWPTMAPKQRALTASIATGLVGGITMLVILKGHAFIHGYDIVIWAIPMNLFLLLFYTDYVLTPTTGKRTKK